MYGRYKLNKVEDNMTGISFLAIKRHHTFPRIVAKTCILIISNKILKINLELGFILTISKEK